MARATFDAELVPSARGSGGHLVVIPPDVVSALGGGGRIPVAATFNGAPYRGSIVSMGGRMMLGVTKAVMSAAGASVGDTLHVVVSNDEQPREVEVPDDLAATLRADRAARERFDALSFTRRRELAVSIAEAQRPDTRARRLERALAMLRESER